MAMDDTAARPNVAFPKLDEAEIAALQKIGTTRHLRDGEPLFEMGDPAAEFFVVLAGAVDIVDHTGDQPRIITTHHAGQFTGGLALLKQWRSMAGAVARGDTEVLDVPATDLRRIIVDRPTLGEIILKAFIARWDLLAESGLNRPRPKADERKTHA